MSTGFSCTLSSYSSTNVKREYCSELVNMPSTTTTKMHKTTKHENHKLHSPLLVLNPKLGAFDQLV